MGYVSRPLEAGFFFPEFDLYEQGLAMGSRYIFTPFLVVRGAACFQHMNNRSNNQRPHIGFIRELCRHLPEERIQEAEAKVWEYVETVHRIAEQLERDVHTTDSTKRDS